MFGSIYVGLSGLSAYSRGLQQVSNNVANLNSSGFKGSTVSFSDLFGAEDSGGLSHANGGRASGNGVRIGKAKLDFHQGELRQTERDLDLAMDGTGFLVLMRGDEVLYTRTGSFEVNKDGFIVLAGTEYRLATLDSSGQPVSLSIDSRRTSAPVKTTTVAFVDNLSSDIINPNDPNDVLPDLTLSNVKVFGSGGEEHVWSVEFEKNTADDWTVTVKEGATTIGTGSLKFINHKPDPATEKLALGAPGFDVTLDFSKITSFAQGTVSSLKTSSVDGHKTGIITSIGVNEQGKLEISYSNEQKADLGAVAIADFRDPQALEQRSGGLFADPKHTQRELLGSLDDRVGRVLSKRLEASNVDLAKQFGDLILIQRGFQASSQIISVSNDMIQQLFGIRGQG
jgi:flagellar hook protein FlgE